MFGTGWEVLKKTDPELFERADWLDWATKADPVYTGETNALDFYLIDGTKIQS